MDDAELSSRVCYVIIHIWFGQTMEISPWPDHGEGIGDALSYGLRVGLSMHHISSL